MKSAFLVKIPVYCRWTDKYFYRYLYTLILNELKQNIQYTYAGNFKEEPTVKKVENRKTFMQ